MKNIIKASTEDELIKINNFFGKIWKKEFNLDRFDRINEYRNSKIYFIEEKNIIISALNIFKNELGENQIGRFATINNKRWKGIGTTLINKAINEFIDKGKNKIVLFAEIKNIKYYKKVGFEEIGKTINIGSSKAIKMKFKI